MENSPKGAPKEITITKIAYSVNELKHEIGVSHSQIYRFVGSGHLKARKLGSKTVFLAEDVRRFLASLPELAG